MTALNALVARIADALLSPLDAWSPLLGISGVALLCSLGLLALFRATSDQPALAATKRRIRSSVFEIRLFGDDLSTIPQAVGEIARHQLTYLRLTLVPLLWAAIPLAILLAHLQAHYGYDGLHPGQPAVVKVRIAQRDRPVLQLQAPPGVRVETPAVWIPALQEAAWRIVPDASGDYDLTVIAGDQAENKRLRVSDRVGRRSPVRPDGAWFEQWLHPSEAPLPDDSLIRAISVVHPDRSLEVAGWRLHWLAVFVVASLLFTVVLGRWLHVTL